MATTKIANLRGAQGEIGPMGPVNPESAPADVAVGEWIATAGGSATQAAADIRYGTTMHAPQYGVTGDGVTNESAALQSLLNAAATFGSSVTMGQDTTVLLASTIAVPTGTRLFLNGATLKAAAANTTVMMTFSGKSDIVIAGGIIDGDKASYAPATEWRHALSLENAHNVTFRDLTVKNAKGDGIYVGGTTACTNITVENVTCIGNHRQGMSVVAVSGLEASNSRFIGTSGTNPQAGVDIEPNADDVPCEDIKFTACTFAGNAHFGFLVSLRAAPTARQGGIELVGCTVTGNGVAADTFGGGVNLRAARDFTMTGGTIRNNNGPGVLIDWTTISRGIKFVAVNIEGNSRHGVTATSGFDDLEMVGCTVRGNGHLSSGSYPALLFNVALASTNLRLLGNTSEGATQRYGVQTNASVSKVTVVGNTYRDNSTGPRALADDAATRLDLDHVLAPSVTGSRGGNAAVTSLLTQLAARGLIVNNTTA